MKLKFLKSVLCVCAMAVLVAMVPASAHAAGKVTTMAASDDVYIRSGPATTYGTVGSIPKGGVCQVFSMTTDGWYKVTYKGTTGYSYYKYINWEGTDSNCINDGNFTVMYATADLKIREKADMNSKQVGSIPSGAGVKVSNKDSGWFKVDYNGTKGWSYADYLDFGQDQAEASSSSSSSSSTTKKMWTVCGLNLREQPDNASKVLTVMPANTELEVTADKYGWYKTVYGGKTGYCYGDYLTTTKPASSSSSSGTKKDTPSTNDNTGNTTYLYATGAVYMRSGPAKTYSVVGTLPANAKVVCSRSVDGWYEVTYEGTTGWTSGAYLSNTKGGTAVVQNGAMKQLMRTTGDVYMRSGPDKSYSQIQVVPAGTEFVAIEGSNGWYKGEINGKVGWISGRLLE